MCIYVYTYRCMHVYGDRRIRRKKINDKANGANRRVCGFRKYSLYSFYFCNLFKFEVISKWKIKQNASDAGQVHGPVPGCGRHPANLLLLTPSLLPSVETVNDGQFHSVELVMLNQTLNLVVDKGAPKSLGKLQKQPAVGINSPLYLGGKALLPSHPHHLHLPPPPPSRAWPPTPAHWLGFTWSQYPLPKHIREGFLEEVTTKLIPKG